LIEHCNGDIPYDPKCYFIVCIQVIAHVVVGLLVVVLVVVVAAAVVAVVVVMVVVVPMTTLDHNIHMLHYSHCHR